MMIVQGMGDSHIAGEKYWIISRVVEVITSQSNEIYHEWPKKSIFKASSIFVCVSLCVYVLERIFQIPP